METIRTVRKADTKESILEMGPEACLVQIFPVGDGFGSRFSLTDHDLTVGRDSTCDIRLSDSSISRFHARVRPETGAYSVLDLHSTNGTFVNDKAVTETVLKDGDYLRCGDVVFRFLMGSNIEARYHEEVGRLTAIDPLTGLYNQRFLLDLLGREVSWQKRHSRTLALLLLGLDSFRAVNDRFGHSGGDSLLRQFATRVKGALRHEDWFVRFQGDKFIIVAGETQAAGALQLAERLRQLVARDPFPVPDGTWPLTVRIGVVEAQKDMNWTSSDLLQVADYHLYQAKKAGGNCVRGGTGPS